MTIAVQSVYQESSQFKRWTLKQEELDSKREDVNIAAKRSVSDNLAVEQELSGKPSERKSDFPTTKEALLIVDFYASKIFETGAAFNLPSHLKATAVTYLKRFYLVHSPLQYHPKSIMITSLFLATKTCEHHVSLDEFIKKIPRITKEGILENEFLLSSSISFDFVHWSAYRPLYGFVLDMESVLQTAELSTEIHTSHDAAKALINASVWSDLQFLYSPSYLALAALYAISPELMTTYLEQKALSSLIVVLQEIVPHLRRNGEYQFDRKQVEAVDRKIYYCSDPAMKKDSAVYERARQAESAAQTTKRQTKGNLARESQVELGQVLS